jgi:hypothetical protein
MTVETREATAAALIHQFSLSHWVIKANIEGMTHEDSVVQPQPGGNCLNWVVGHLVGARQFALQLVGKPATWNEASSERYRARGAEPIRNTEEAAPFSEIIDALDASQEPLLEGLRDITAEQLAEKAPFSPTNNPDETVGSLLAGLSFHEAYTAGQTGLLRRLLGKEGVLK